MAPRETVFVNYAERRDAAREEVYFRTRVMSPLLGTLPIQIVDVSASGYMARTEAELSPGDTLTMRLPVVGDIKADIRWALGGRIGCQFERMIPLPQYLELLGTLVKDAR